MNRKLPPYPPVIKTMKCEFHKRNIIPKYFTLSMPLASKPLQITLTT